MSDRRDIAEFCEQHPSGARDYSVGTICTPGREPNIKIVGRCAALAPEFVEALCRAAEAEYAA